MLMESVQTIYSGMRAVVAPSIAIDAPMTAVASWQATAKHQVLMFTVVFVFSFLFTCIEWLLSFLGMHGIAVALFSFVTSVLVVAVLSEAYKTIMSTLA